MPGKNIQINETWEIALEERDADVVTVDGIIIVTIKSRRVEMRQRCRFVFHKVLR
jgi:hypothetical protein